MSGETVVASSGLSEGTIVAFTAVVMMMIAAAAVFGTWRQSRSTANVTTYRDAAAGWEAVSKAKDAEIQELKGQLATANQRIDALNQRVSVLQDMVTSKTLIEQLGGTLHGDHETLLAKIDQLQAGLKVILTAVGDQNAPR